MLNFAFHARRLARPCPRRADPSVQRGHALSQPVRRSFLCRGLPGDPRAQRRSHISIRTLWRRSKERMRSICAGFAALKVRGLVKVGYLLLS
jgi:hypothetical protein